MIRFERVSKHYLHPVRHRSHPGSTIPALRNISLHVTPSRFVAIMGPSGCGKSTLLHLAAGLDTPTTGGVYVNDKPLHTMNETDLSLFRRKQVGVVFQFFNLLPQLTVVQNVMLPLRLQGQSHHDGLKKVRTLLSVLGLSEMEERLPVELSGGEQQRVAIARAMIHHPDVLLADEPTGNLDSESSQHVLDALKRMHQEFHATILLVTHSQEVAHHADQLIQIQDGNIISESPCSTQPTAAKG